MNSGSETEAAWCDFMRGTLVLPSRQDTPESARALSDAYTFTDQACQ